MDHSAAPGSPADEITAEQLDELLNVGAAQLGGFADLLAVRLLDGVGPEARGLGQGQITEIGTLLLRGPSAEPALTAGEAALRGASNAEIAAVAREAAALRRLVARVGAETTHSLIARHGRSEPVFRRGRPLAERLGYDLDVVDSLPPLAVEWFVGLANPWFHGPPPAGATVVDVGCGFGFDAHYAAHFAGTDGRVMALDATEEMLRRAIAAAPSPDDESVAREGRPAPCLRVRGAAEAVPLRDGEADVVVANGVVCLVASPAELVAELVRLLRPGGQVRIADYVFGDAFSPDELGDVDRWNMAKLRRFPPAGWIRLLGEAGLTDIRLSPPMDPYVDGFEPAGLYTRAIAATKPS